MVTKRIHKKYISVSGKHRLNAIGRIINELVCIAAVFTKYFPSLPSIKDSQQILFVRRNSVEKKR